MATIQGRRQANGSELEKPGALDRAQQGEHSLAGLIRWYIDKLTLMR